jgi:hypothetical protein
MGPGPAFIVAETTVPGGMQQDHQLQKNRRIIVPKKGPIISAVPP